LNNSHHRGQAEIVIQAEGLTKQFNGHAAVNDIVLQVPRGVIFGLIGPSGCGKTTTVRLLTGVHKPTAGRVKVLNQAPAKFNAATRRRLGYMPQSFVLYPGLTVWQNLNFVASLYGLGWRRGQSMRQVLDFVELTEHGHKAASDISGGMQRRLALACTLAHNPQLLFLDEPTAGVDPVLRRKFWDYFKKLQSQGHTLFVTTQYVGEAAYCDLVGVMSDGRLLVMDTPDGLRHSVLGGDILDLRAAQPLDAASLRALDEQPFARGQSLRLDGGGVRLAVDDASTAIPALMEWCKARGLSVVSVEEYKPPLDDVFVELMKQTDRQAEPINGR
jgi:ABC-2 type transport system ATP-binding protein